MKLSHILIGLILIGLLVGGVQAINYTWSNFTANGTYTCPVSYPCVVDVTVIGGGASGASQYRSGGGSGEVMNFAGIAVSAPVSIIIGNGGIGVTQQIGAPGGQSSFGSYTAKGGLGDDSNNIGGTGGSGGGAASGLNEATYGGDGGSNGTYGRANSLVSNSSGTLTFPGWNLANGTYGIDGKLYAGAGGGSTYNTSLKAGIGGLGGGGDGGIGGTGVGSIGKDGTPNTGGGGGGSANVTASAGGRGGSGYVMVRYDSDVIKPIVQWITDKTTVVFPGRIYFNDTSLNTPTQWNWSFGDGTWFNSTDASTGLNKSHQYLKRGRWIANLTVSNSAGTNTSVYLNKTITVIGYQGFVPIVPDVCRYSTSRELNYLEKLMTDCKVCGVCG